MKAELAAQTVVALMSRTRTRRAADPERPAKRQAPGDLRNTAGHALPAAPARVVMLVDNTCISDRRVITSAEILSADGYDVTVVRRSANTLLPDETVVRDVRYRRVRGKPPTLSALATRLRPRPGRVWQEAPRTACSGSGRPAGGLRRTSGRAGRARTFIRSLYWVAEPVDYLAAAYRHAVAARPDVVHAHDLTTLPTAAAVARCCDAKLVYDSHELETDRNVAYPAVVRWWRAFLERTLITRTHAVVTVSESLGRHLAETYRIREPTIVENVHRSDPMQASRQGDVRQAAQIDPTADLAVYIGALVPNRGIEQTIQALTHDPALYLAVVGPDANGTARHLRALAEQLGVGGRVSFHPPVPPQEVSAFVATASVSVLPIQNTCLSYDYCFPNKLMESVYAGLPLAVARLTELRRFIDRFGCGELMDEADPADIARVLRRICAERARYAPDVHKIAEIERHHGWAVQEQRLRARYAELTRQEAPC
jgi:glycosyltransferase involved in cell wall biosynthesis